MGVRRREGRCRLAVHSLGRGTRLLTSCWAPACGSSTCRSRSSCTRTESTCRSLRSSAPERGPSSARTRSSANELLADESYRRRFPGVNSTASNSGPRSCHKRALPLMVFAQGRAAGYQIARILLSFASPRNHEIKRASPCAILETGPAVHPAVLAAMIVAFHNLQAFLQGHRRSHTDNVIRLNGMGYLQSGNLSEQRERCDFRFLAQDHRPARCKCQAVRRSRSGQFPIIRLFENHSRVAGT